MPTLKARSGGLRRTITLKGRRGVGAGQVLACHGRPGRRGEEEREKREGERLELDGEAGEVREQGVLCGVGADVGGQAGEEGSDIVSGAKFWRIRPVDPAWELECAYEPGEGEEACRVSGC